MKLKYYGVSQNYDGQLYPELFKEQIVSDENGRTIYRPSGYCGLQIEWDLDEVKWLYAGLSKIIERAKV